MYIVNKCLKEYINIQGGYLDKYLVGLYKYYYNQNILNDNTYMY